MERTYSEAFLNAALERAQPSHASMKEPVLLSPPKDAPIAARSFNEVTASSQGPAEAVRSGTAGGGGGGSTTTPFEVLANGAGSIRVRYGTVNGILPDGMSIGDSPIFTLSVSGDKWIILHLTCSFDSSTSIWSATGAEIIASPTFLSATTTDAYTLLGSVSSGGDVGSDHRGSLQWERDGDDTNFVDTFVR
jgi:hypothetical protein